VAGAVRAGSGAGKRERGGSAAVGTRHPDGCGSDAGLSPGGPAASNGSGDGAGPANGTAIKGPAARLVQNMNESLGVPTATTFRELSVATLERQRKALNDELRAAGRSEKISFTHLIGWAIVQATKQHPVMSHTFAQHDGTPYRITPPSINLGLAVDVTRKDGSRGLVVPVIKGAETMDFAASMPRTSRWWRRRAPTS
jgi:2-oxoglutarate dehydrogenase E1 component